MRSCLDAQREREVRIEVREVAAVEHLNGGGARLKGKKRWTGGWTGGRTGGWTGGRIEHLYGGLRMPAAAADGRARRRAPPTGCPSAQSPERGMRAASSLKHAALLRTIFGSDLCEIACAWNAYGVLSNTTRFSSYPVSRSMTVLSARKVLALTWQRCCHTYIYIYIYVY